MAVYGYVRASTDMQEETLGVQSRQIEGYALMLGLTLHDTFIEVGVSGSVPFKERPQGGRLLAVLGPGDVVISPKLDRCFRSSIDALEVLQVMKDGGVSLHLIDMGGDVTGSGISKLLFTILSAVAEAERDRIRERISDVKRDQRQRGRYLGGKVPFGYRVTDDGNLAEIEEQQAAIRDMLSLKGQGLSLRVVAEQMKARGFTISHNAVREITGRAALQPSSAN
jgi:DNA invertase Pin-like site-specific DNA recombinase